MRARERPFVLVAPDAAVKMASVGTHCLAAAAHHENFHRRVVLNAVMNSLQPAVVPSQAKLEAIKRSTRAEVGIAMHRHHMRAVNPWSEDHSHRAAFVLRKGCVTHRGLARPRVVPSADEIYRHVL